MTGWCSKPPWGPQHDLCNELLASSDLWMDLLKSHMFYGKSTAKQFFEWNTRWKPIFCSCNLWFCPVNFHWNQSQSNPMIERQTSLNLLMSVGTRSKDLLVSTNCNEDFCPSIGFLDPQIFHDISKNSGNIHLVGGIPTPLKNMTSSLGMIIPNIWKNKKCSKPPTSHLSM